VAGCAVVFSIHFVRDFTEIFTADTAAPSGYFLLGEIFLEALYVLVFFGKNKDFIITKNVCIKTTNLRSPISLVDLLTMLIFIFSDHAGRCGW
jgi:hypothetical protein